MQQRRSYSLGCVEWVGVAEGGVVHGGAGGVRPGVASGSKGVFWSPKDRKSGSWLDRSRDFPSNELYFSSFRQEMAEIEGGLEDFSSVSGR